MIYEEGQAFLRSYDSAPNPSPPVSKLTLFISLQVCHRSRLLTGEGGGEVGGRGAESYDPNKASLSINRSILSGLLPHSSNRGSHRAS